MTCKDCIHSGLCYKKNDYMYSMARMSLSVLDNFPDKCADFISNKILEERPQGEWIRLDLAKRVIAKFEGYLDEDMIERIQIALEKENEVKKGGADMRGDDHHDG